MAFSMSIPTHTKPCLEYVNTSCRYKAGHFVITALINPCQATDGAIGHQYVGRPDHQTVNVIPFRQVTSSTNIRRNELLLFLLLFIGQNNSVGSFGFSSKNSIQ